MKKQEAWECVFGMKSQVETVVDGLVGLVIKGWASKYNVVDSDGEFHVPGSLRDAVDSWGRQAKPLLLYQHGRDAVLKMAAIGWGLKCEVNDEGLYVECFIPREPTPPFRDDTVRKNQRYREIYDGIKSRKIRHFSIGGLFERFGKALASWSMHELTVTPAGCLGEAASFYLGGKAVGIFLDQELQEGGKALFSSAGDADDPFPTSAVEGVPMLPSYTGAASPPPVPQSALGVLPRPAWGQVMQIAQRNGARTLHDHLMSYPAHLQGQHDAENCPICSDARAGMGVKDIFFLGQPFGEKAEKDGPDSDYLVVDAKGQHLRVKVNGTPSHRLMGQAYAALTSNFRGNPYEGSDKGAALAKLRRLYAQEDLDWPGSGDGTKADHLIELQSQAQQHAMAMQQIMREARPYTHPLLGGKAGKALSKERATRLRAHADALGKLKAAIDDLLRQAGIQDDEDTEDAATESAEEKQGA